MALGFCLKDSKIMKFKHISHIYVGRKAWICTIHGLRCAKHGSMLCVGNPWIVCSIQGLCSVKGAKHGFAQSMDCVAQSMDPRFAWAIYGFRIAQCERCEAWIRAVRNESWIALRNAWIRFSHDDPTIECAVHGFTFCMMIHRLPAQTIARGSP